MEETLVIMELLLIEEQIENEIQEYQKEEIRRQMEIEFEDKQLQKQIYEQN